MKMIPKNTFKIVMFLLKNRSELGHNINQISRIIDISVGSAFKILKSLQKKEIVIVAELGNAMYYKLDLRNQETAKLCELLLIEERRTLKGFAKLYSEELKKFDSAELIILFGSVLRGNKFNDIDALFMTANVKKVTKFCLDISKIRTKPVVPTILKKQDLISEIKNKNKAILEIIRTGVVIKGESKFINVIKNAI